MSRLCVAIAIATIVCSASLAEDLSLYPTADTLWFHIEKLRQGPINQPATVEERQKTDAETEANLNAAIKEFVRRYPSDRRRWEAQLLGLQVRMNAAKAQNQPLDAKTLMAEFREIGAAADAPTPIRADARYTVIQLLMEDVDESNSPEAASAVETETATFQTDFPNDPRLASMQWYRVYANEKANPAKAEAILREMSNSSNTELAAEARRQLRVKELMKKPLDLKFAAVDGRAVDLEKLRGKVVLLDFWATWCGPCIREVPNVVAAHGRLHEKGFEIVGISLDRDKQKLLSYTKDKGMTWPQYFDGKVWQNEISTRFGIRGIPAMWIVDKKGFVRTTDGRGDLVDQVEKLLAE